MADRDQSMPAISSPAGLRLGEAPYVHGLPGIGVINATFLAAVCVVLCSSIVLFGWHALRVLVISVGVALLVESSFHVLTHRARTWSEGHALFIGALLACTLPPTVPWQVPAVGAAASVLAAHALLGGLGSYFWHPVALGRVLVQFLYHNELEPSRWQVLAPGHLVWGSLSRSTPLTPPSTWASHPVPTGVEAYEVIRPVDLLRGPLPTTPEGSPAQAIGNLVCDALPPWMDTLFGTAGGMLGEACLLAILIGGLLLLWRGLLRGWMVIGGFAAAAVMAALLPVRVEVPGEPIEHGWLAGTAVWQGVPVGLAYVCYHLTAGELGLILLLLAPDPSSSPLNARGHTLFGVIIGAGTILLRMVLGVPAAGYWALLFANSLVPVIDRRTRRRVFGT